jgi:hypothetical protein
VQLDRDGVIRRIAGADEELLGENSASLVGKHLMEAIYDGERDALIHFYRMASGTQPGPAVFRTNGRRPLVVCAAPVYAGSVFDGVVGVVLPDEEPA